MARVYAAYATKTLQDNKEISGLVEYENVSEQPETVINNYMAMLGYKDGYFTYEYIQGDFADEAAAKTALDAVVTVGPLTRVFKSWE